MSGLRTATARLRPWVARHPALAVAVGYLVLRLTDLVGFALLGADTDDVGAHGLLGTLGSWDGGWFVRAVESGWPDQVVETTPSGRPGGTTWAWPPLYPLAGRAVGGLLGATDPSAALIAVSALCGLLAALVLYRATRAYVGPLGAVGVALLWASMPSAPVLVMAYSEALFCLLAFASLLAVCRDRFVLSGILVVAAGLVRVAAAPFAVALLVSAWLAWRRQRLSFPRLLVAAALAVVSVAAWPAAVAVRAASLDGYSAVQAAWGRSSVPFHDTAAWLWLLGRQGWPEIALTLLVVAAMAVSAVAVWRDRRYPLAIRLIGAVSLAQLLVVGIGYSGVRLSLSDVALPAWLRSVLRPASVMLVGCLVLLALRWAWIGVYVGGGVDTAPP